MTDTGLPGKPTEASSEPVQEAHKPTRHTRPQPISRLALPRNKRAWVRIALPLIALAAVSAVLIAMAIGGGTNSAGSGASSAAPGAGAGTSKVGQAHNGVSKAKNEVTSAAQLARSGGALSLPASMKSSALTWQAGRGGADLADLSSRAGNALQAAGVRQYLTMKGACARLAGSVSTAHAGPPIPVAAMQSLYTKALAELAKGAAGCRAAISSSPDGDETVRTSVNNTMLHQSMSELTAGVNDVFRSTAEIQIASRQHSAG